METKAIKTQVIRTALGWVAQTEIELDGARVLNVRTCRSSRGALTTVATVSSVDKDGHMTHLLYGPNGDYSDIVFEYFNVRVTENAVRAQHELALAQLPRIRADIARHYARQQEARHANA